MNTEIRKLDQPIMVTKSFLPPFDEYAKEIESIWSNHWLTNNGKLHQDFEKSLKNYLKVSELALTVNGHLALEIAIKTLGLTGEVITTPFTFASTTHAIVNCGLTPVFCDIEREAFNIDTDKIESLITEKTSAILPVHVFGNPCNITAIERIASKHNLKVIYDAAHAFGVEVDGFGIANFGDISMFSLHATKVFHSIEGGVLSFRDLTLKGKIDLLKNFGISGPEDVKITGSNAKMNEFQAAMGIVNLRYIHSEIEKRKKITTVYRILLKEIAGVSFIEDQMDIKHNYSYFPIIIEKQLYGINRDELHDKLKTYNVFTRKYFYPLCSNFDCYKEISTVYDLPNANYISENILTLPLYSDLEIDNVEKICEMIKLLRIHQD